MGLGRDAWSALSGWCVLPGVCWLVLGGGSGLVLLLGGWMFCAGRVWIVFRVLFVGVLR